MATIIKSKGLWRLIATISTILYTVLLLAGLKYILTDDIMPYHKAFLGTELPSDKEIQLILGGLRIIGAAFMSCAILCIYHIWTLPRRNKTRRFIILCVPVFLATIYTTTSLGVATGAYFFLALSMLTVLLANMRVVFSSTRGAK